MTYDKQDGVYIRCAGPLGRQYASRPGTRSFRCRVEYVPEHLRRYCNLDRAAYRNAIDLDAICANGSRVVGDLDGRVADLWSDVSLRRHLT